MRGVERERERDCQYPAGSLATMKFGIGPKGNNNILLSGHGDVSVVQPGPF